MKLFSVSEPKNVTLLCVFAENAFPGPELLADRVRLRLERDRAGGVHFQGGLLGFFQGRGLDQVPVLRSGDDMDTIGMVHTI